jgi:hypothetical protein
LTETARFSCALPLFETALAAEPKPAARKGQRCREMAVVVITVSLLVVVAAEVWRRRTEAR